MEAEPVGVPADARELAAALAEKPPSDTRHAGVYVIYDGESGEPLYVDEAANVYRRLCSNHRRLDCEDETLRERVEADEELERETEWGAMWEWTEWAWIPVSEGRAKRREVARAVESVLDPRYSGD